MIFADEPTAALDWNSGQAVMELLRARTRSDGMSAFVVTHDARVLAYADVRLHLEDGRLTGVNEQ